MAMAELINQRRLVFFDLRLVDNADIHNKIPNDTNDAKPIAREVLFSSGGAIFVKKWPKAANKKITTSTAFVKTVLVSISTNLQI